MPVPFIIGLFVVIISGVGISKVNAGRKKRNESQENINTANKKLKDSQEKLETKRLETKHLAEEYGLIQAAILEQVVNRLIRFMNKHHLQFSSSEKNIFEGIGIETSIGEQNTSKISIIAVGKDFLKTGSAAGAGFYGVSSLASSFGTTAAGTSISGLSGAAGTNATLAYLGGGSLASGGGGMFLGTVMLGGVAIGVALLVSGYLIDSASEKELTASKEYQAKQEKASAEIETIISFLGVVDLQIIEQMSNAQELMKQCLKSLAKLEALNFSKGNESHARQFQETMILITTLIELIKTPILNSDGDLNVGSATVRSRYKKAA